MQCPSCGATIPYEDVLFCEACGFHFGPVNKYREEEADLLREKDAFSQYEPLDVREFSNIFLDLVGGVSYLIPDPEIAAETVIFLNDGSLPYDVRDYVMSEVEKSIVIHCGGPTEGFKADITLTSTPESAHLCLFGIGKALLEQDSTALDHAFIKRWCLRFEDYQELVLAYPWEDLQRQTGVSAAEFLCCGELISCTEGLAIVPLPVIELPEEHEDPGNDAIYSSYVPGIAPVLGTQNALELHRVQREEDYDMMPKLLTSHSADVFLTMNILALLALTGSIDTPGGMRIPLSETLMRLGGSYDLYAPNAFEETAYYKYEEGELQFDGSPGFNTISGKIEFSASALETWGLNTMPYLEW